jgi:hypothetical protein
MAQRPVHIAADRWFTTLAEAIGPSDTEFDLTDVSLLPALTPYRDTVIVCGQEKIRIISVAGDTVTAERGFAGTTAASHVDGKAVAMLHVQEFFNDVAARLSALEAHHAAMFVGEGVKQDGGLQVVEDDPPSMTVVITAGLAIVSGQPVRLEQDVEIDFTAPTGDPRIDIIQIDQHGAVTAKLGTEAGSPTAPAVDADNLLLAEVHHVVGETIIEDEDDGDGYIVPEQVYL